MRIFISHKFRGENKAKLRKKIEKITTILKMNGHRTFNYFRDRENWQIKKYPFGYVITEAFKEIRKCDAVFGIIDNPKPSEGMILEFGFAKALKKKTILLISKRCSSPTLEAISDEVIKFIDTEDIDKKLTTLRKNFK